MWIFLGLASTLAGSGFMDLLELKEKLETKKPHQKFHLDESNQI